MRAVKKSFKGRNQKKSSTKRVVLLVILCIVVAGALFGLIRASSKSSEQKAREDSPGAAQLWSRLKKRLFDQDLPLGQDRTRRPVDMNEISTPSPSPGLNPTHVIEEDDEGYPNQDRKSLDGLVKKVN